MTARWQQRLLLTLALLGVVDASYLLVAHFTATPLACPSGGLFRCDYVVTSRYSVVAGLPLAAWGLVAYLAVLGLALLPTLASAPGLPVKPGAVRFAATGLRVLTTAMLAVGAFLAFLMAGVLHSICLYCAVSIGLSAALFGIAQAGGGGPRLRPALAGLVLSSIAVVAVAAAPPPSSVPGSKDPEGRLVVGLPEPGKTSIDTESGPAEIALARSLAERGSVMYGGFDCPHCVQQKLLFGKEAWKIVPYFECDPRSPQANEQACDDARVAQYPTWVLAMPPEDYRILKVPEEGKPIPELTPVPIEDLVLNKFEGVQDLEDLANITDYMGPREFRRRLAVERPIEQPGPPEDDTKPGPKQITPIEPNAAPQGP
ncbi:MAG: vitamin K epoxide reductase family protein [Candidatus Sericytochromatia bacterium]|nr:vitamin K epoxide reductase family protein [Candidatus Tanganyikabacteria bacterium]